MESATQGLRDVVERMVDDDAALDAECGLLVLAALAGDSALASALGQGDGEEDVPADVDDTTLTAGSYLASITVEGFRGIGEPATLEVHPGPGLTVVAGRNGSGKSSFAEAAELAITGTNRRWDGQRSAVWREGWRNLHRPHPVRVVVETVGDGRPATVTRSWSAEDPVEGGTWTRQERGAKVQRIDDAGAGVRTYRPFLSYNELGSVIDGKPSEMHDALHTLLGLDELTAAQHRVTVARKARDDRAKAVRGRRQELATRAGTLDDERATRVVALLQARSIDLDGLGEVALGSDGDVEAIALLRRAADVALPLQDVVEHAALELDEAREALGQASSSQARASADMARLLRTALDHHAAHGDSPCPVCGQGSVDAAWRVDAEQRTREADEGALSFQDAQDRVETARAGLAGLVIAPPEVLSRDLPVATREVRDAWYEWSCSVDALDAAVAVEEASRVLRPAVTGMVAAAKSELARRDDQWRPLAVDLVELYEQITRVEAEKAQLAGLRKSESWLKEAASAIRAERLRPFAEHSQRIWNELRQQSNVDLGLIRLEGSSNRRRATFDVTVDDVEGAALGVMSQGELHSLALSLFLPRATVEESPFRYVLIDDPVQAMDPAKVDGLARVLAAVARDRQVIVFSHDDRLAESVRRMRVPATIVEVVRRDRSHVELEVCSDPVARHLDDARALVASDHVPDDLRSELVASYCRSAVEAAAHAAFRRARIGRGDDRTEVEQRLERAHMTHDVLTLAVFHDEGRGRDLYGRLSRGVGSGSVDVLKACKQGAHGGYRGSLRSLVSETATLCDWVVRQ